MSENEGTLKIPKAFAGKRRDKQNLGNSQPRKMIKLLRPRKEIKEISLDCRFASAAAADYEIKATDLLQSLVMDLQILNNRIKRVASLRSMITFRDQRRN